MAMLVITRWYTFGLLLMVYGSMTIQQLEGFRNPKLAVDIPLYYSYYSEHKLIGMGTPW